jgi:hypothetical protein
MIQMHNESLSPTAGRFAGLLLLISGVATAIGLADEWPTRVGEARTVGWLAFLLSGTLLALVAVWQGARMLFAPRRSRVSLPNAMLVLGVILLFVMGVALIVLSLVEPSP